jgi:hypothetical protein
MSGNVLTHDPNPYASPPPAADEAEPLSTVEVKARLRKPALGLLASAVWGIGVALFLGALIAVEKLNRLPRFTEQDQNEVLTYGCMLLAFLLVAGTIARGALAMLHARDIFAARNAAILAVLPCGGAWLIGLPFGVWALWVLRDPRVKQEFRRHRQWHSLLRPARPAGNLGQESTAPPPA